MKKYIVNSAFSLLERVLVVDGDTIYAEEDRLMISLYSPKTRKRIGRVPKEKFNLNCSEVC